MSEHWARVEREMERAAEAGEDDEYVEEGEEEGKGPEEGREEGALVLSVQLGRVFDFCFSFLRSLAESEPPPFFPTP